MDDDSAGRGEPEPKRRSGPEPSQRGGTVTDSRPSRQVYERFTGEMHARSGSPAPVLNDFADRSDISLAEGDRSG
jgi:hypothetical protein